MQRLLYVVSLAQERKEAFIERLKRDRFDPDPLPILNSTPSSHVQLSLTVTIQDSTDPDEPDLKIKKSTQRNMLKLIFQEYQVNVIEGPQNVNPTRLQKLEQHLGYVGKETLVLFIECLIAIHSAILIVCYDKQIDFTKLPHHEYPIFVGISAVPSLIYFLTSGRKYNKTIE